MSDPWQVTQQEVDCSNTLTAKSSGPPPIEDIMFNENGSKIKSITNYFTNNKLK